MPLISFRARIREPKHPLAASPYVTRCIFFPDLMHLMDCKGVSAIVFGSILVQFLRKRALGPTMAERLRFINGELDAWYSGKPKAHRLPHIDLSNVTNNGWADLHGPAIKAANTRASSGFFLHLSEQYLSGESDLERSTVEVAKCLDEFYKVIYGAERFMTAAELRRLRSVCLQFGEAYMRSRAFSRRSALLAFEVTPKVHKMQHVPAMAQIMNPRFVANYAEESLVGTTAKVWKRSMSGRYKKMAQFNVLMKKALGVLLSMCMTERKIRIDRSSG